MKRRARRQFVGTSKSAIVFLSHTLSQAKQEVSMLGWAVTFLVIALIAAFFGWSGVAAASAGIAQILFFVFLVLFIVAMVARAARGRPPV